MAIADKLTQIAENEYKVYDAGKEKGYADGYEQGAKTERERFWDRYLHGGERTISWGPQNGLFNGRNFGFDNFYPTCDIKPVGDASYLFYNWSNDYGDGSGSLKQRLEECGVVLDTSKATLLTCAFAYSHITEIPTIDCRGLGSGTKGLFQDGYNRIHFIEKLIVNEDVTFQNWFLRTNVTEMRFEGGIGHDLDVSFQGYNASQSTLSADSIRSIIEHLSDTAQGKTLTLSRTAVDKAFEESEGANDGSLSQEWEWYLGCKPNWNIVLA